MTITTLAHVAAVGQGIGTSGRSVGARVGPWLLGVIDSADIADDRLDRTWEDLRKVLLPRSTWTEKRLLRPYDVLVTARASSIKVALVPPALSRSVAAATLLVVRPREPGTGLAHFLWYFLTSRQGRSALAARITRGMTIPTLSARALAEMPFPVPHPSQLVRIAKLVEESDVAYRASVEATRLRRDAVRDAVVHAIVAES